MRPLLVIAALSAFCAAAAAQNVIIVDSQNRPGTQFTSLGQAVQFAQAGDILLVRDGSYVPTSINKGIQIHALPGATINEENRSIGHALRIENIPAGESVTIKGLRLTKGSRCSFLVGCWYWTNTLHIENCSGPVLLEDVVVDQPSSVWGFENIPGLVITESAQVAIAHCRVVDRGGMSVANSTVVAHDSRFIGEEEKLFLPGIVLSYAAPGVTITAGSSVYLSRCEVRGGDGGTGGGEPGIRMSSPLQLTGVAGTSVTAGAPKPGSPVSAIDGTGSLTLDPIVTLVPSAGAPPVGAGIRVTTEGVPSLSVTGAPLGGQVRGDLRSAAGEPFAVLLGLPAPILVTPFGQLWVDPTSSVILASGTLGAGGTASWTLSVPNVGTLLGVVLTYQGAAVTPNGLRLSNPGQHVLDA